MVKRFLKKCEKVKNGYSLGSCLANIVSSNSLAIIERCLSGSLISLSSAFNLPNKITLDPDFAEHSRQHDPNLLDSLLSVHLSFQQHAQTTHISMNKQIQKLDS